MSPSEDWSAPTPDGLLTASSAAAGTRLPRFEELAPRAEAASAAAMPRAPRARASDAASQGEDRAKLEFVIDAASKGTAWFQDDAPLRDDLRACVDRAKLRSC